MQRKNFYKDSGSCLPMRKEAQTWLRQSDDDFDGAEYNFKGGKLWICLENCSLQPSDSKQQLLVALYQLLEPGGSVPNLAYRLGLASAHSQLTNRRGDFPVGSNPLSPLQYTLESRSPDDANHFRDRAEPGRRFRRRVILPFGML
jgi:hypothetical protein